MPCKSVTISKLLSVYTLEAREVIDGTISATQKEGLASVGSSASEVQSEVARRTILDGLRKTTTGNLGASVTKMLLWTCGR